MKHSSIRKTAAVFFFLLLSTAAFCKVRIETDYSAYGEHMNYHHMFSGTQEDYFDHYYADTVGYSFGMLWDFDTEKDGVTLFTGFNTGLAMYGFPVLGVGGVSVKLAEFGPFALEFEASDRLGVLCEIYGKVDLMNQINCSLVLMGADRKGFYGSIGITDVFIPVFFNFSDGWGVNLDNSISARFAVGYRF